MSRFEKSARRIGAATIAVAVALGLACGVTTPAAASPAASPAAASPSTVSPIADRASTGVTADALPTVQIDGVVWSQVIVGNTVYAGGDFANARPAGAALGTQETPRSNLLAYNLSTGELIATFAPVVNGTIKSVVASPDGSRVYIGGAFTTVNGLNRYRIAAFDTATGQLDTSFQPGVDATVNSLSATNTTVYAGGIFSMSQGVARTRLAAFSAADGALLAWNPTADDIVDAVQLTPSGKNLIIGGAFQHVNGSAVLGLASIDATTGTMVPFAANQVVQDYGKGSAILSLSTDGTSIYGTGYVYGAGNFEGTFSADPDTGTLNWLEDCHGDTYGAYAGGGQVYVVSHEHFCGNIGGFPDTNPRNRWTRTSAFTNRATGTVATNSQQYYANLAGNPSPSLVNWFPDLSTGLATKQYQAAWTITGNGKYVIEGGEFPKVNGINQQGLVRFAVPSLAPNKRGPMDTDPSTTTPTAIPESESSATVSWPSNWDQDNESLTYRVMRSGSAQPVDTQTAVSQFWNRPTLSFTDTGLTPGSTYDYTVYASDADGNTVHTATVSVSTPGTPPAPTTTTMAPAPATPVAGQPVNATVTVQTADGTPADTSVSMTVDGGAPQVQPLTAGTATVALGALSAGTHTVVATSTGNALFLSSTQTVMLTVRKDATTASATVLPAKPVTGQRLTVRSAVATTAPGTAAATGTVAVSVDGRAATSTALTKAAATTALAGLPAGRHTVTIRYSGDAEHAASSTSRVVTVAAGRATARVTSSKSHASRHTLVHFRATVRAVAPAVGTPAGTVVFYVDGHRRATRTLYAGGTTYSVRLPKGKHRVQIRYSGAGSYYAVTSAAITQRTT